MKRITLMALALLSSLFLSAQSEGDRPEYWYYDRAEEAIEKENYEYALSLLNEGQTLYPDSFRLIEKTGDLYYDKELYSLALDSYRKAEILEPERASIIYNIGSTLARLNENDGAIEYYERLIAYESYHRRAVDDLSWLYYKVHRLKESEELLLRELDQSFHRNYAITLGTVYSDMYDYERSREYYLASIEDALKDNARYFASVALYNLSLLEYSFYNYEQSLQYTGDSLDSRDRASGHLARGEILQLAGRYREAEEEYLKAESMDNTPLSRIALGGLYQKTGHLEKALAYMNDVYNRRDMSWMYFFGTDHDQYAMDLSAPMRDIYKAKAEYEKRRLVSGPLDWGRSLYDRMKYSILSFYYDQIFRKSARIVGDNTSGKSDLNSWWSYSRASLGNRPAFMKYIGLCESFELELTDKAIPWYLLERGRETEDPGLLEEALSLFRPDWEVEPIMETLEYLVKFDREKDRSLRLTRLGKLYELNSGGLFQNGLALPLLLELSGSGSERKIKRLLERTGSIVSLRPEEGFAHKLIVRIEESRWNWYLLDSEGSVIHEGEGDFIKLNNRTYRSIVMSVVDRIYAYTF